MIFVLLNNSSESKSNFHYTRGITPQRVTQGAAGSISAVQRLDNTAPNKRRSGGKPLTRVCLIWLAQELNPRPPAPIAMFLTTTPIGCSN